MTVTFDSGAWIEYFAGSAKGQKVLEIVKGSGQINTATLSITEIKTKYQREDKEFKSRLAFIYSRSKIIPLSKEIAENAAELRIRYKLHTADAVIYATSVAEKSNLITTDPDLENCPDVEKL